VMCCDALGSTIVGAVWHEAVCTGR